MEYILINYSEKDIDWNMVTGRAKIDGKQKQTFIIRLLIWVLVERLFLIGMVFQYH